MFSEGKRSTYYELGIPVYGAHCPRLGFQSTTERALPHCTVQAGFHLHYWFDVRNKHHIRLDAGNDLLQCIDPHQKDSSKNGLKVFCCAEKIENSGTKPHNVEFRAYHFSMSNFCADFIGTVFRWPLPSSSHHWFIDSKYHQAINWLIVVTVAGRNNRQPSTYTIHCQDISV